MREWRKTIGLFRGDHGTGDPYSPLLRCLHQDNRTRKHGVPNVTSLQSHTRWLRFLPCPNQATASILNNVIMYSVNIALPANVAFTSCRRSMRRYKRLCREPCRPNARIIFLFCFFCYCFSLATTGSTLGAAFEATMALSASLRVGVPVSDVVRKKPNT